MMSWSGKKFSEVVASKTAPGPGPSRKDGEGRTMRPHLRQMQKTDAEPSKRAVSKGAAVVNRDLHASPSVPESKLKLQETLEDQLSEECGKGSEENWETVGIGKKKSQMIAEEPPIAEAEITAEELEQIRQAKREKRKREKEGKKKKKEEEKRLAMMAPKTSKIKMISADVLQRMLSGETGAPTDQLAGKKRKKQLQQKTSTEGREGGVGEAGGAAKADADATKSTKGIRFMDDEYPTLATESKGPKPKNVVLSRSARDALTGKQLSDAESGSEWETDVEDLGNVIDAHCQEQDENKERVTLHVETNVDASSSSYSSILKATKQAEAKESHSVTTADSIVKSHESKHESKIGEDGANGASAEGAKKVKKKDPITFDLFEALNTTKRQGKKMTVPATKKAAASAPSAAAMGGNMLDSGAPSKRRGKERERPKRKKKTPLKRQILEARENKKQNLLAKAVLKSLLNCDKEQKSDVKYEEPVKSEAKSEKDKIEEPLKDTVVSANSEPNDAAESEINGSPQQKVEDDAGDIQREENQKPSALIEVKKMLHKKKFRDYCDHDLSKELDEVCKILLQDVVRFQDKQFNKDPVKAKARRRYVVGLREVKKFLVVRKVRLVIIAPDLENVEGKGGLNECIEEVKRLSAEQDVPIFFVMNRWGLGKAILRKVPVSIVGVMNFMGTDENFKKMVELRLELKSTYDAKFAEKLGIIQGRAGTEEDTSNEKVSELPLSVSKKIQSEFVDKLRALSKEAVTEVSNCD